MAFRRRRRFGFRRRRRSVNWLPGLAFDWRALIQCNPGVPTTDLTTALIQMTANSDLAFSGGEGSVITRILGQLMVPRVLDSEAGLLNSHLFRAAILKVQNDASGGIVIPNLFTSDGLGYESLLWTQQFVTSDFGLDPTSGLAPSVFRDATIEVDVKAKRRISIDDHLHLIFTFVDIGANIDVMELDGYLRYLMMRPV